MSGGKTPTNIMVPGAVGATEAVRAMRDPATVREVLEAVPGMDQEVREEVPVTDQEVPEVVPVTDQEVREVVPGTDQEVREVVPGTDQEVQEAVPVTDQEVPEAVPGTDQEVPGTVGVPGTIKRPTTPIRAPAALWGPRNLPGGTTGVMFVPRNRTAGIRCLDGTRTGTTTVHRTDRTVEARKDHRTAVRRDRTAALTVARTAADTEPDGRTVIRATVVITGTDRAPTAPGRTVAAGTRVHTVDRTETVGRTGRVDRTADRTGLTVDRITAGRTAVDRMEEPTEVRALGPTPQITVTDSPHLTEVVPHRQNYHQEEVEWMSGKTRIDTDLGLAHGRDQRQMDTDPELAVVLVRGRLEHRLIGLQKVQGTGRRSLGDDQRLEVLEDGAGQVMGTGRMTFTGREEIVTVDRGTSGREMRGGIKELKVERDTGQEDGKINLNTSRLAIVAAATDLVVEALEGMAPALAATDLLQGMTDQGALAAMTDLPEVIRQVDKDTHPEAQDTKDQLVATTDQEATNTLEADQLEATTAAATLVMEAMAPTHPKAQTSTAIQDTQALEQLTTSEPLETPAGEEREGSTTTIALRHRRLWSPPHSRRRLVQPSSVQRLSQPRHDTKYYVLEGPTRLVTTDILRQFK